MAAELGAHEVMELHEVLTDTIDGINQFQLYRPHVKDPQLRNIVDNQIGFMTQEYNNMVQTVSQHTQGESIPYRRVKNVSPSYGLNNPSPNAPNMSADEMDDRDVASGALGCHKSSASIRMKASLEFADPTIRRMLQQGAINCSEQAFEVWNFMNQKGLYQVPTMKPMTTSTMINTFNTAQMPQAHMPQMHTPHLT
ncbi:MAG TPA: spore coat protein [Desulfotomaculum sp.]|nr:MAG: coat protein F [Peptococcaceae bacterium BRH_c8a]KJS75527.1 MAG: coat protein F [Desulfotomaculum sp. BICA1-6]HBX23261.1 spore coat protein [Desulfotomaculum sp.]